MNIVFLTGAGMSAESGVSTFRDAGGLWDQYPVMQVASHTGWEADPVLVNNFYNEQRRKLLNVKPCRGHELIAQMESNADYSVSVITQNVDNLHERAGSTHVLHLHGELMKVCSSRNTEDPSCWQTLTASHYEVKPGEKAKDGSLLRPYIVFFEEAVPNIAPASRLVGEADVFVIIGTSLNVYPAAGLIAYTRPSIPIYLIDPKDVRTPYGYQVTHIKKGASAGMEDLIQILDKTKQ